MSKSWLIQSKAFDWSVNIAPQTSFCYGLVASFQRWKAVHFRYWNPCKIRIDTQTPFANFWKIWKNTNRSVVTFFFSTVFFVQGAHLRFFKVFNVFSVFDALVKFNIYIIREKTTKTFNQLSWDIIFVILSFGTCWKENEESEFSKHFLIEIMLGWFLYLAIAFYIGSLSLSVFIKNLGLVFIPKLGIMFIKNSLKILANSLLLLIIFPSSSSVIYSVDFILLGKRGFTVAENVLLSVMSFRFKFS